MHIVTYLLITSLGVVQGGDVCIAPHMPGPSFCKDCDAAAGDNRQGGQCVSEDRWLACYDTIDACCNDGELKNNIDFATCVSDYKAQKGATHTNGDPDVPDSVYCTRVIAKSGLGTTDCQKKCMSLILAGESPLKNSEFSDSCQYDHFLVNNNRVHFVTDVGDGKEVSEETASTHTCYDHWVYGYSEPDDLAGDEIITDVKSPALCQALCQASETCVRFTWTASTQGADEGQDSNYRCALKTRSQVDVPLSIKYTSVNNPSNYDEKYCNYGMAHECWTDHYKCLPCEGAKRCVWYSDFHVNGWKTCDHEEPCKIDPSDDSTQPAPTDAPPHPTDAPPHPTDAPTDAPPEPTDAPCSTTDSNCTDPCCGDHCHRPCRCAVCPCPDESLIMLKVADRPKFLQLQVRN